MDEKRVVIAELWAHRIYLDENVKMNVETIQDDPLLESCPKCTAPLDEIYSRPQEEMNNWSSFDLVVLRCGNCNLCYAYYIEPYTDEHIFEFEEKQHGKSAGNSRLSQRNKLKLHPIIQETSEKYLTWRDSADRKLDPPIAKALNAGLNTQVVNAAKNLALSYFKNHEVTLRQTVSLFAAAVYQAANMISSTRSSNERREGFSGRQLEKIFGPTPKTIRRWRKLLRESGNSVP